MSDVQRGLVTVALAGAILAAMSFAAVLMSAEGRPSSDAWLKLRQQVFEREGVSFAAHHHDYETDHIIPVCLKGPSTLDNLQLQRCYKWEGPRCVAGPAYEKDLKEISVCRSYREGKLTLEQARASFQRDR